MFLENVQSPVASSLHVDPYDIEVKRRFLGGDGIHGGDLRQRVAVASTLFVLVAHHRHEEVPNQLPHQRSHGRGPEVLASFLLLTRLQQHAVQHQSVAIDEGLWFVVDAGVVEHQSKVLHQSFNILVTTSRHVAAQAFHVDGSLDVGVVIRQLGARWQAEEDGAEAAASAVSEVTHSIVEFIQLLLERREVFGFLWRNTSLS